MKGERGATLVELLVGIGIAAVLVPMLIGMQYSISHVVDEGNGVLSVTRDLQNTQRWLAKDIPLGDSSNNQLTPDPDLGVSTTGSTLTIVYKDYSQPSPVTSTIAYSYDPAGQSLTRSVDGGAAITIAYHLATSQGAWFALGGNSLTTTITSTVDDYSRTQTLFYHVRGQ